ncbi:hypothetical protein NMG60_11018565 [Bertholletia excelsa]
MAATLQYAYNDQTVAEEEYIDMEVISPNSNFFYQPSREFEFQMFSSSSSAERDTSTSPADELFYMGKLLPLHLPPRLQMVEKLLLSSDSQKVDSLFEEFLFGTPPTTSTTTTAFATPASTTPFESCNVSPCESCRVSRELNPEEYFFNYEGEESSSAENPKKSWTKKLKLGSKLRASRAYLKALFGISGCSDHSCDTAPRNVNNGSILIAKEMSKKTPFGQIQREGASSSRRFGREKSAGDGYRRSFSGAIKRLSAPKTTSSCSQSISGLSSNGLSASQFVRKSGSVCPDIENSIQGAIAHCKRSQGQFNQMRKTGSEVGFCSMSASMAVLEDQERPMGLCRG